MLVPKKDYSQDTLLEVQQSGSDCCLLVGMLWLRNVGEGGYVGTAV